MEILAWILDHDFLGKIMEHDHANHGSIMTMYHGPWISYHAHGCIHGIHAVNHGSCREIHEVPWKFHDHGMFIQDRSPVLCRQNIGDWVFVR